MISVRALLIAHRNAAIGASRISLVVIGILLFYAEGAVTRIGIFWDDSRLRGLFEWLAAEALGFPYRLVKAQEIVQGTLSDKTSLLIVLGALPAARPRILGKRNGSSPGIDLFPKASSAEARTGVRESIEVGRTRGLPSKRGHGRQVGAREPRTGVVKMLFMALRVLIGTERTEDGDAFWRTRRARSVEDFSLSRQGAEIPSFGRRLAAIMPEAAVRSVLGGQRPVLFGSAIQGGGLWAALSDVAGALLFFNLGTSRPGGDE